jgi:hypothetical protein
VESFDVCGLSQLVSGRCFCSPDDMSAKSPFSFVTPPYAFVAASCPLNRRTFLRQSLTVAGGFAVCLNTVAAAEEQDRLKPMGEAKGYTLARRVGS